MANEKKLTDAEIKALREPVEVTLVEGITYKGDDFEKGATITVTKAQSELLKARGKIK